MTPVTAPIRSLPPRHHWQGVLSAELDQSSSEPALKVSFIAAPDAGQQIAQALVEIIETLQDPIYEPSQPVFLRYIDES